ncbi:hypothetical protein ACIP6T_23875 [Pantoea sp. NPDC088449]|uniref:hypothetical protein n=1 Tax=Pantoea sp. NPDC088449 TaxID=3364392 RepID=UPI0037FEB920
MTTYEGAGIVRRGNLYAGNYRNRKRENASGYIGSNPAAELLKCADAIDVGMNHPSLRFVD